MGNLGLVLARLAELLELGGDGFDGLVDAPLDFHWIRTCGDVLCPLAEDGLSEDRCGGGPVTGGVTGLAGHFADQLSTHVLIRVLQFDFFRDRHTVLGDGRRPELLVQNRIPALRTECRLDGVGKLVHPFQDGGSCCIAVQKLLCHWIPPVIVFCSIGDLGCLWHELAGEDPENVFFLEDQALFVFDAKLAARILVE